MEQSSIFFATGSTTECSLMYVKVLLVPKIYKTKQSWHSDTFRVRLPRSAGTTQSAVTATLPGRQETDLRVQFREQSDLGQAKNSRARGWGVPSHPLPPGPGKGLQASRGCLEAGTLCQSTGTGSQEAPCPGACQTCKNWHHWDRNGGKCIRGFTFPGAALLAVGCRATRGWTRPPPLLLCTSSIPRAPSPAAPPRATEQDAQGSPLARGWAGPTQY